MYNNRFYDVKNHLSLNFMSRNIRDVCSTYRRSLRENARRSTRLYIYIYILRVSVVRDGGRVRTRSYEHPIEPGKEWLQKKKKKRCM